MFNKFKQLFKKANKTKKTGYKTTQSVSFRDMSGTDIVLEIKTNGNNTLLWIRDKKENVSFAFDKELSQLLLALLQTYYLHETFPDLSELID